MDVQSDDLITSALRGAANKLAQDPVLIDVSQRLITGADALTQIVQWKDVDSLFEMAHFIGVTRPGHVLDAKKLPASSVSLLEVPAMAISSTDCRRRVERNKPVWYLVPDGVVQYINKYRLYRAER